MEKNDENKAVIRLNIDYKKSVLYQSDDDMVLVIYTTIENITDTKQQCCYHFWGGKLCKDIAISHSIPIKGLRSMPLQPKMIKATATSDLFDLSPYSSKCDVLIVVGFAKEVVWRLFGDGKTSMEIDKSRIRIEAVETLK